MGRFKMEAIGKPVGDKPWVAHVKAVDLDQDGRMDIVSCEAKDNTVSWFRQSESGDFEERVIARNMRAPVHAEAADMDQDGDLDLIVSCMSVVFPNNDKIGAIIALENQGNQSFAKRILLEDTDRVTDARPADLNGDGLLDLAVGQFGYDQGEIRWMEQLGPWTFESHSLLKLSGAINVGVADLNEDGHPDIVAQLSQQWEEIHLFENDGRGNFVSRVIWGSTNEDYACSGMRIEDLNLDGRPDLLFSNGDGFGPSPIPGPRPWHGVQWLENQGAGAFRFHRIGDLAGAYSPIATDLDLDGDMDVIALSCFNAWSDPKAESLVWFENDGQMKFDLRVLAYTPIQLLALDIADFDGSGSLSLATGGFHAYPPYDDRMSRIAIWKPQAEN